MGGEHDRAIVAPCAAAPGRRVAQRYTCAAGHRDFLQLTAGEKRQPFPVRRKEWALGIVGAWQRHCLELVEVANIELRTRVLHRPPDECDDSTVGRKDGGSSELCVCER